VDELIAALRDGLDDCGDAGDADAQTWVERDLDLRHGAEPPVDIGVGADDLDLVARDPAFANLPDRAGGAVYGVQAVCDERHPRPLLLATLQAPFLAGQKPFRGRVRDDRETGLEDVQRSTSKLECAGQ
jgi:hypothetical protein